MKKLGAILAVCVFSLSLSACGETPSASTGSAPVSTTENSGVTTTTPTTTANNSTPSSGSSSDSSDPNTRTFGDCSITLLDYSIQEDSNGDPAVRIEYLFTNYSKTAGSFSTTVIPNAYQGEATLHYTTPSQVDSEYSALLTLVDPGDSIICAGYFALEDTETPIQLEVTDLRDSSAKSLMRTLDIVDMQMESYIESTTQSQESSVK